MTEIHRYGVSKPKNASSVVYGRTHLTDFLDVLLKDGPAFGIDHLFYEDGEVELRIQGYQLENLLNND